MHHSELIPHLFRIEYSKIVSSLCRHFGFGFIESAEDVASETFLTAAQVWGIKGLPANPTAWLYSVAKNKARNVLKRDWTFVNRITPDLQNDVTAQLNQEIDLPPEHPIDSQLAMMFALCHPSIPQESQVGLSLRILCGFGIDEIADAFLTTKETINKRLFRAKQKLREEKIQITMPDDDEISQRIETVLLTLYLLFSEGYYSSSQNTTIRKDLCLDAMRLCNLLLENEKTNVPQASALMALMCFHASRLDARVNGNGEVILYDDQDRDLWNQELIARGTYFLHRSAVGDVSKFHLEATIAFWLSNRDDKQKWEKILQLYDRLLELENSPLVALNRTYAFAKIEGKEKAIAEAEKLNLISNHFYFVLLGELYTDVDHEKAKSHFAKALSMARAPNDKKAIGRKIAALETE